MENEKTTKQKQPQHGLPIRRRIERGTTGICIVYSIDEISKPEYIYSARTLGVQRTIEEQIMERLWHYPDGELTLSFISSPQDSGPRTRYGISVTYRTAPDYRFLSRIFAWLYNFSPDEALTAEDFRRAYGPALGDHIFGKWCAYRMDITRMIGYFGTDYPKGQAFLGLLMDKVVQYERRLKEQRKQKEPSDRAAPSVSGATEESDAVEKPVDAIRSEPRGEACAGAPGQVKATPCGAPAGAGGLDLSVPDADAAP